MKITESADTVKKDIKCGLGYLPNSSNVLVPIMFADDTNFSFFLAQ